jgi:hypothetical protein
MKVQHRHFLSRRDGRSEPNNSYSTTQIVCSPCNPNQTSLPICPKKYLPEDVNWRAAYLQVSIATAPAASISRRSHAMRRSQIGCSTRGAQLRWACTLSWLCFAPSPHVLAQYFSHRELRYKSHRQC